MAMASAKVRLPMIQIIDRIRYAPPSFWRGFAFIATAFVVLFYALAANARWSPQFASADPEIKEWFRAQHNSEGQWCCDEADGHEYDGGYTFNPDGSVTVSLNGKPHILPKHMILTGTNPTGHAIWWFLDTEAYGHIDYCFAPGTLS
jgi:hypothetical protein